MLDVLHETQCASDEQGAVRVRRADVVVRHEVVEECLRIHDAHELSQGDLLIAFERADGGLDGGVGRDLDHEMPCGRRANGLCERPFPTQRRCGDMFALMLARSPSGDGGPAPIAMPGDEGDFGGGQECSFPIWSGRVVFC